MGSNYGFSYNTTSQSSFYFFLFSDWYFSSLAVRNLTPIILAVLTYLINPPVCNQHPVTASVATITPHLLTLPVFQHPAGTSPLRGVSFSLCSGSDTMGWAAILHGCPFYTAEALTPFHKPYPPLTPPGLPLADHPCGSPSTNPSKPLLHFILIRLQLTPNWCYLQFAATFWSKCYTLFFWDALFSFSQ